MNKGKLKTELDILTNISSYEKGKKLDIHFVVVENYSDTHFLVNGEIISKVDFYAKSSQRQVTEIRNREDSKAITIFKEYE